MPFFLVDDQFCNSKKAVAAQNRAIGLWTRAGSWSMQQLTDGHIPTPMITGLGGNRKDAQALVDAGLWHTPGHDCPDCPQPDKGSYVFHQWLERQPTAEKINEKRRKDRERLAEWRHKQAP